MVVEKAAPIHNDYIRLAGTSRDRSTGVPRLYLGPNHLLLLNRRSTSEVARRIYYEDITALRCRPTRWGYYIDGTLVTVAALLWLNYLVSPDAGTGSAVAAITVAIVAGIALLTNWLRGPTCETWMHTANHAERLTTLGRYNTARHALAKLHDRIVEAQAEGYGEDAAVARAFDPYAPLAKTTNEMPLPPHDNRLMTFGFYASIFLAFQGVLEFIYGNDATIALGMWTALASLALSVAAIIRSFGTDCPPLARKMCACLVASMVLGFPITLAAFAFLALFGIDPFGIEHLRDIRPSDGMLFIVWVGLHVGSTLFNGACAITGLAVLSRKSEASVGNVTRD